MKKIYVFVLAVFALLQNFASAQNATPQKISVVIGKVLNAGSAGVSLPDGNRIYAKKVATGGGDATNSNFGDWGQNPASLGGYFNGVDNVNEPDPGTAAAGNALTLGGFNGDKTPATFTRISGDPSKIANGDNNKHQNSIGIHIWFDKPVNGGQYLFVDVDGNTATNGEWISAFGYNGAALVSPGITLSSGSGAGTLLAEKPNTQVNAAWNTMISNADNISSSVQLLQTPVNGLSTTNPHIVAKATDVPNTDGTDPDNIKTQVLFDFGNNMIDHFFALWGIKGDPANSANQNSGMSAFISQIVPDFGDAPDSYGTLYASGGASHGIFTGIKLGATEDSELTGDPSALANNDADDDGLTSSRAINFSSSGPAVSIPGYSITVNATNNTGNAANLVAWIDWNADGMFDAAEAASLTVASTASGSQSVTLTWTNKTLTHTAGKDYTILRIRLSTDPALTTSAFAGAVKDGEVEDYALFFPANSSLPLNFISFSAVNNNNSAVLKWVTASEINADKIDIQSSVNGIDFTTVGTVKSTGNGSGLNNNYQYSDANLSRYNAGVVYYKLKQVDLNGQYSFSTVVAVNNTSASKTTMRPNILQKGESVTINIKGNSGQNKITVFSSTGQVMLQKTALPASFTLGTANLSPGNYYIQINSEDMQKLIVQ